ncbi:hypothetical protein PCC6311_1987 [Synechococcus elongatus PCC 6311]|nr:hypothetical protein M744_06875 [Synechococcus elongatus UTEX 2973]UOW71733.1 hypothetical protein PCC7943_1988 [Synechococcus elongatus PCC 7943]UOW74453.1 hypothetical protein PCC6311_1987 [Synechococcus elongatus PCC 6311]UOW77175.1 hypothetical protein PCC6301pg_1989 [Synechococcus elongatus PCC 6301]
MAIEKFIESGIEVELRGGNGLKRRADRESDSDDSWTILSAQTRLHLCQSFGAANLRQRE